MTLSDAIESVLELQSEWTAANSTAKQKRGELIRKEIPTLLAELSTSVGLATEGRDGAGSRTRVPWVRIFDPVFSPSATKGWYIVFLFGFDGANVFLSLNQGTTEAVNRRLAGVDPSILMRRTQEARTVITDAGFNTNGLLHEINLKDPGGLGDGYQHGNAFAIKYERGSVPHDETIKADLLRLVPLLKSVYAASDRMSNENKNAYLLVWNPEKWGWSDLPQTIKRLRSGETVKDRWTVVNKSIKPGDRVFVMRLGSEPKGIIGSGHSVSVPYETEHYSGETGKTQMSVDVRWDSLLDPNSEAILNASELQKAIPEFDWFPQRSGTVIPQASSKKLEILWKHYGWKENAAKYTSNDALNEVFLDKSFFEEICELARRRKNIVLQGPPGVGKTFIAKRLA